MTPAPRFARKLLIWWRDHGRHDLPWQGQGAYAIWVSEIMLQQTQASRVIAFYVPFIERFPTVAALASADINEILQLFAGLGYYARAHNLHRAAKQIVKNHNGQLPADIQQLLALPGIGASTAHAIVAQAFGRSVPILDANVKRIIARFYGITSPINTPSTLKTLWQFAAQLMPARRAGDYTQAIMDLGALVCRKTPLCQKCPVASDCVAYQTQQTSSLPQRMQRGARLVKTAAFVLVVNAARELLFVERPKHGIWPGLWCLPTLAELAVQAIDTADKRLVQRTQRHTFTHFHLDYSLYYIFSKRVKTLPINWHWCQPNAQFGMPAPIYRAVQNWKYRQQHLFSAE